MDTHYQQIYAAYISSWPSREWIEKLRERKMKGKTYDYYWQKKLQWYLYMLVTYKPISLKGQNFDIT
jgi:hypothetical protein